MNTNTYSYDLTSPFAIFWTGTIDGGPTSGQYVALDGTTGSETTDKYTYDYWSDNATNDVLKQCLSTGSAFGSGFFVGGIVAEQTLLMDWLTQSFTRNGARIDFVTPV